MYCLLFIHLTDADHMNPCCVSSYLDSTKSKTPFRTAVLWRYSRKCSHLPNLCIMRRPRESVFFLLLILLMLHIHSSKLCSWFLNSRFWTSLLLCAVSLSVQIFHCCGRNPGCKADSLPVKLTFFFNDLNNASSWPADTSSSNELHQKPFKHPTKSPWFSSQLLFLFHSVEIMWSFFSMDFYNDALMWLDKCRTPVECQIIFSLFSVFWRYCWPFGLIVNAIYYTTIFVYFFVRALFVFSKHSFFQINLVNIILVNIQISYHNYFFSDAAFFLFKLQM